MSTKGVKARVRIVLVEDSPSVQIFLTQLLEELDFEVAGCASEVASALRMVRALSPDLVLADVHLPDGDGIELSRRLLQERGIPIVLITGRNPKDPRLMFEATRAGALEILPKPPDRSHPDHERLTQHLARTLRTLAGTRIVSRRADPLTIPVPTLDEVPPAQPMRVREPIIAIGSSTGGPPVLAEILKSLAGREFAFAVVIQHMVPDFIESFREWLESQIGVTVRLAEDDRPPEKGVVYLAPPRSQIMIQSSGRFRVISSTLMPTDHVPSIDVAFTSLAAYRPAQTTGIVITGMGADGARGLKALRVANAFTIAQSPQTAVVDSMPKSAIDMGAALVTLNPGDIRLLLEKHLALRNG